MGTLEHILNKHNLHTDYIEIPNVGRKELAVLCRELNFQTAVEIGVASGEYSAEVMALNPSLMMWGVDPYERYEGYNDYKLRSTFERMESEAHAKLDQYPNYQFKKKFSLDVARDFGTPLDFVYIDGNHSGTAVREDIEAWAPKVVSGGIIAGHDFTGRWPSLRHEVISYCKRNGIQLFVLGLERKDLNLYRDTSRSWMFVQP